MAQEDCDTNVPSMKHTSEMRTRRSPLVAFLPATLLMALIFYLSTQSTVELPETWSSVYSDKILHALAYGTLAFFFLYGFLSSTHMPERTVYAASWLITVLYGLSDEFHQSFTPGRDSSLGDLFANTVGATVCIWLYARLSRTTRLDWLNIRSATTSTKTHPTGQDETTS